MGRNIEIKARADDLAALAASVATLGGRGPETIRQEDTFFPCAAGRLKLRKFADGTGELIASMKKQQRLAEKQICDLWSANKRGKELERIKARARASLARACRRGSTRTTSRACTGLAAR